MKKRSIQAVGFALVFIASYLGISVSRTNVKIGGETSSVTLVELGTQAKAYCNESQPGEPMNDGKCTGAHNDASTRCLQANSGVPLNCLRDTY
jgi:hypothetical protein